MAAAWVPVKEAAARLGVSEDTIKRRLKARRLRGRQMPTAQGYVWQVRLDATAAAPAPTGADAGAAPPQGPPQEPPQPPGQNGATAVAIAARLEAHVGDLRAQVARLGDELEARRREQAEERETHRREVERLHTLLAQAHQLARPALPAPAAAGADTGANTPAPATAGTTAAPSQPPPRPPWWRRLFSWDGAGAG